MEEHPASAFVADYPEYPKRRTRSRRREGRLQVLLLLALFWCSYIVTYAMSFMKSPASPARLRAAVIINALWVTVLLVGIWRRQNWARCVLIALLGLAVLSGVLAMTVVMTTSARGDAVVLPVPFADAIFCLTVDVVGLVMLMNSRRIRYLTSPRSQRCDADFR